MMRLATQNEVEERARRVRALRRGSPEDRVVAILMDTRVGGFGMNEDEARAKAAKIIAQVHILSGA